MNFKTLVEKAESKKKERFAAIIAENKRKLEEKKPAQ